MIGFAGLSHLGIVSSIAAAAKEFDVVGYDPNKLLCNSLNEGDLPILEPDLESLLSRSAERICFSADIERLKQCDLVFISLDVTTDNHNKSDLQALHQLIESVICNLQTGAALVVLCQVPPGFTRQLQQKHSSTLNDKGVVLYYQVETLIFGRAVERAMYPERLIVGGANPDDSLLPQYASVLNAFDCPVLPMSYESAELTKISINMCLVSSISVANTMAELCESIGADWSEIVPALKLDKRIGEYAYLAPGLGLSGGNLERDLVTIKNLAMAKGADSSVVNAFMENSRYRQDWVLRVLRDSISLEKGCRIAIWGLAYKANTHSVKNSPALALIENLVEYSLRAYDPQVELHDAPEHLLQVSSALEACEGADALVIMTPWVEFTSIDFSSVVKHMPGRVLIDPYQAVESEQCSKMGFQYITLGR
jgi:UDPglucose 6-dehydrogenase